MIHQNFVQHFVDLANELDAAGFHQCASAIDGALQQHSLTKVAQYVGAIGYVLKQERAMANCIRKKRAASTGPMQEVVLDCLKEYQDGQNFNDTEWTSKYAQVIKALPDKFAASKKCFISELNAFNGIDKHVEVARSVQKTLDVHNQNDRLLDQVLANYDDLNRLI